MNDRLITHNLSDAEIARAERLSAVERYTEGVVTLKRAMPLHEKALGHLSGGVATAREYFANRVHLFKAALPVEVAVGPDVANQLKPQPIDETAKLDAEYTFKPIDQQPVELDADSIRAEINLIESLNDTNITLAA